MRCPDNLRIPVCEPVPGPLGDAAFKDGGEGVVYLIEYAVGDLVCSVDGLVNGVGPIQEEGAFPDLVPERLKVL